MAELQLLREHLARLGRVVLGYSGGVDSAFLAVVAGQTLGPERFLAVTGRSASLAADQARSAADLAKQFRFPFLEIATRELDDPRYLGNPTNRCYFCKAELWGRLSALADELGFDTIIDGTHADDLGEHRPGMRAGQEYRIRSPLAELASGLANRALPDPGHAGPGLRLLEPERRPLDNADPHPPDTAGLLPAEGRAKNASLRP